jgi:PAS domain S-box-containing protein
MVKNPTVLVVNDDPSQLRITSKALSCDGFEVLPCADAEQALRLLGEGRAVDVVVTDLYMPGIDGWRLCRLLRSAAFARFNTIPILVVSAIFSGSDAEDLTVQLGADGFLAAPYEPAKLCRVVRNLIGDLKPVPSSSVLIVEPDLGYAQHLTAIFESAGYSVAHAANGSQALAMFRQEPRQVVVLDYDYSEVMSERLIDTIKEPGTATVVMVVTSDNSAERAVDLIRKGADHYVHKPLAQNQLVQLCETAVRQRALLRIEDLLQMRTRRLRASEDRYRNLFENAGDGIVTYTLDGITISINRALEGLLVTTRDELVGKSYERLMTAVSFATAKKAQQQARASREDTWTYTLELVRPDGTVVPAQSHCRFLRDKEGEPTMIMATYRDLTVERLLERQRAEFTAMLAHDIRNPLALIRGCAELLLDDHGPAVDAPTVRKCHERIHNAAQVVDSLVSNYLELSRIEAGALQLTKQRVDLAGLLRSIVERFEGAAEPRAIRFQLCEENHGIIDGDALALDRVFANLLNNAFKFTPDGGAITLNIARHGDEAMVSVRDSGPGIDPAKLSTLFQKFNRIEINERQEGIGLGLFIVKELVAAHGGRVEVESCLGQGSCFAVFLPLANLAAATN